MSALLSIWIQFLLCATFLAVAGIKLIRYGDAIASLTGLCSGRMGIMLMGAVTSLPDLAVGDALGSGVSNVAILAVAGLPYRRELPTPQQNIHVCFRRVQALAHYIPTL